MLQQTARHYIAPWAMCGAVNGYWYAVAGAITCEDGEADVAVVLEGATHQRRRTGMRTAV